MSTLTSRNRHLQAESLRLTSIVHYLEDKNQQMNREIFRLQMTDHSGSSARFPKDRDAWNLPQIVADDMEISSICGIGTPHLRKEEECVTEPYTCSQRYTPIQDETVTLHTPVKPIKLWEKTQATPKSQKHSKRESVGKGKGTMAPLAKKGIKARGKEKHLCHRSTGNVIT